MGITSASQKFSFYKGGTGGDWEAVALAIVASNQRILHQELDKPWIRSDNSMTRQSRIIYVGRLVLSNIFASHFEPAFFLHDDGSCVTLFSSGIRNYGCGIASDYSRSGSLLYLMVMGVFAVLRYDPCSGNETSALITAQNVQEVTPDYHRSCLGRFSRGILMWYLNRRTLWID